MKPLLYIFLLLCVPVLAWGETSALYTLSGVPEFEVAAAASETGDFSVMINTLYRMSIGIGVALAVLVLVFEGMRYAASDLPGVKENLRQRMTYTIGGLLLLLGAYVLFSVINPRLTIIEIGNLLDIKHQEGLKDTNTAGEDEDQLDHTDPADRKPEPTSTVQ